MLVWQEEIWLVADNFDPPRPLNRSRVRLLANYLGNEQGCPTINVNTTGSTRLYTPLTNHWRSSSRKRTSTRRHVEEKRHVIYQVVQETNELEFPERFSFTTSNSPKEIQPPPGIPGTIKLDHLNFTEGNSATFRISWRA